MKIFGYGYINNEGKEDIDEEQLKMKKRNENRVSMSQ